MHVYPDECRLEIPSRGIDAKLHVTTSKHILVKRAFPLPQNGWVMLGKVVSCERKEDTGAAGGMKK